MHRVLMVGTSENSGGGISSVIRIMKKMPIWQKYSCRWLGTQIQGNAFRKLLYATGSAIAAPFVIPRFDIVHFHIVPGTSLITQLPELIFSKLYGKKIILEIHIGNQLASYTGHHLFKWWMKQANEILLLAHKWVKLFHELYPDIETPVDVLYNSCEMIPLIPYSEKKKLILFAGTINDNKAPDLLLNAWANLKVKYADWKINILGSGELEKFKRLSDNLGLSKCVDFTGYLTGKDKEKKFHDASIFCLCSYNEGFPMVVLEAWTHNIAVITTPVGGLPDVINNGENCLVFQFGDVAGLTEKLDILLSSLEYRERIANGGYKCASSNFSLETISPALDKIYIKVLN